MPNQTPTPPPKRRRQMQAETHATTKAARPQNLERRYPAAPSGTYLVTSSIANPATTPRKNGWAWASVFFRDGRVPRTATAALLISAMQRDSTFMGSVSLAGFLGYSPAIVACEAQDINDDLSSHRRKESPRVHNIAGNIGQKGYRCE